MATLDSKYLSQLLHDAHLGSSDAYAAIYTGTLTDVYRQVWKKLHDVYMAEDAMEDIYVYIFSSIPGIHTARQFYTLLNRKIVSGCEEVLAKEGSSAGSSGSDNPGTGAGKDIPDLSPEFTGQLLENIFEKCHIEPNKTPLDVLSSYNRYRSQRYGLQQVIIVLVVILLVITPILFIPPSFDVTEGDPDPQTGFTTYTLSVNNRLIPVKSVAATINEQNMPVYQVDRYTYRIEPYLNGLMSVRVTLYTNQDATQETDVTGIDATPPTVTGSLYRGGKVYLTLEDNGSGLDYDSVYLSDAKGKKYYPVYENKVTGVLGFDMIEGTLELTASDNAGNVLHAHLHLEARKSSESDD